MTVLHRLEQRSGVQGELRIFGGRHMGGRLYDPGLGRFLQADSMVQDPLNSQSLNRYSYVLNNPMTYTDPTGYFSVGDGLRLVAAAVIVWCAPYLASYLGGGFGGAVWRARSAASRRVRYRRAT